MSDERPYMERWAILRLCDYEIDAFEHIISYYDPREVPKRLLHIRDNLERAPPKRIIGHCPFCGRTIETCLSESKQESKNE
jgi:hypothetical protein